MSTGHILLGLLSRGEQHGYELKQGHDALFPSARPMAYGQIYAALARLTKQGLIEVALTEQAEGPERTLYRATPAGRAELEEWMSQPEQPATHINNPLATKVGITLLTEGVDAAERLLDQQRAVHLERMRERTQERRRQTNVSDLLASDYSLAHLDADMRWINDTKERLTQLHDELP